MSPREIFLKVAAALEKAGIAYMVVGSFASNLYGRGRATQDIDIVISATPEQVSGLLNLFPKEQYYFDLDSALEACRTKSMFNLLDTMRGWKVDFIFAKPSSYHREAFKRRIDGEIEDVPLFVQTAEDTIISKLEWGQMGESSRQIEDVAGILQVYIDRLDRSYIEKWVHELGLSAEWTQARKMAGVG